jgi:hypothetical protein
MKGRRRGFGRSGLRKLVISLAAIATAGPVTAQVSEADRLQRCENNRSALAQLQERSRQLWSDERIARTQAAVVALARLRNQIDAAKSITWDPVYSGQELQAQSEIIAGFRHSIAEIGRSFDTYCLVGDTDCVDGIPGHLTRELEQAVARRGEGPQIARQIALHETNLRALGCDEVAGLGGDPLGSRWSEEENGWRGEWVRRGNSNIFDATWTGSGTVRAVLTISISGDVVSVSRQNASDTNNCQYQGVLRGRSVSGTYQCVSGGGQWSATIE